MAISERTKEVLDAIIDNPGKTAVDIAAKMGCSIGQVTGAVNSLKKQNMILIEDGKITATAEAEFEFGDGPGLPAAAPTTSKKVAATSLAADTSDQDDGEATTVTTTTATETVNTTVETTSTETIIEAEATTTETTATDAGVTATDVNAIEELADTPTVMSTLIPGTAPASVSAPAKPAAGESKAAKARAIFMANKDQPRKVLMAMMIEQCGLTAHGANTYLYNFRKAEGMVKTRTTETAEAAAPSAVTEADTPAFVEAAADNIVIDVSAPEVVAEAVEAPAAEVVAEEVEAVKAGE